MIGSRRAESPTRVNTCRRKKPRMYIRGYGMGETWGRAINTS
jgi:hypothetical protein